MVPQSLIQAIRQQDLPLTGVNRPHVAATIKSIPEDFEVEEVEAYPASGAGDHTFLWVEKRDVAGRDLILTIADAAGVPPADVGSAGLKDRRAVTRQWISIPSIGESRLQEATLPESIKILKMMRHSTKLRLGHLHGNHFRIVLRGASPQMLNDLRETAKLVSEQGFPNLFGEQRFGRDGRNLDTVFRLLEEGRRFRLGGFERRMAISALQSALFNRYVTVRIQRGLGGRVLLGDVMAKAETGGLFVVEDPVVEQARLDAGETRITGPIYGHKMKAPTGDAAKLEAEVLEEAGLSLASFKPFAHLAEGTRRAMFVRPRDLDISEHPDGLVLTCTLPKGTYVTVLLREFVQDAEVEEQVD